MSAIDTTDDLYRPVHIAASPYKTATSSIGRALIAIGVGTSDMGFRGKLMKRVQPLANRLNAEAESVVDLKSWIGASGPDLRERLGFLLAEIRPHDVFSDAPYGHAHLHPAIRKALSPGARFIWVHRPFEDWVNSVRHWEVTHPDVYPKHGRWTTDPASQILRLRRLWDTHYARFCHTADLFPDDCLELDIGALDSYRAICAFYRVPEPDTAFPKANVTATDRQPG
ncbi:hypothetical protein [Palleronia rufa]|uniref:hypothetical protein n=1 Tax=Palleronia rufa TaxID=1530186 RepID=UPI0005650C6D|nr:hypothetical protein [Palleronia rufa]